MLSNRTSLIVKTAALTLVGAGAVGSAVGLAVLRGGWYNVAATSQHLQPVHTVLEKGMHYSVRAHAKDIVAPPLGGREQVLRGAIVYRDKCAQCHGGPGFAQSDYGKSMQPIPGPLVDATSRWKPRELYWITRHGVKMSGMPAWEYHMSDSDLWAVVAFVTVLPRLTPQAYREMTASGEVR